MVNCMEVDVMAKRKTSGLTEENLHDIAVSLYCLIQYYSNDCFPEGYKEKLVSKVSNQYELVIQAICSLKR